MSTYIQGSFRASDAVTVRFTYDPTGAASTADWSIGAGTTYATANAALLALQTRVRTLLGSSDFDITAVVDTDQHNATVRVTTPGLNFSIDWSHAGDGSALRTFLGESGNVTDQASGYTFSGPLAAAWHPPYDLRRLDLRTKPWDTQRLMTSAGAPSVGNPHTTSLRQDADAEFWFGSSANYDGYGALRDCIEGVFTYGQPFVIGTDVADYTCRFPAGDLKVVPEPVEDTRRGTVYRVSLPVVVV